MNKPTERQLVAVANMFGRDQHMVKFIEEAQLTKEQVSILIGKRIDYITNLKERWRDEEDQRFFEESHGWSLDPSID